MRIAQDLAAAVGNTPLLRLRRASEETGCEIFGKCEFLNPGQSVKDRAALYIIRDAIARGELEPGGTIVEGTAGNTGIGLALVGASMGFKTVIVIPETQSQEKKDMLRLAGADLVQVPAAPYSNPQQFCALFRAFGRRNLPKPNPRRDLGQSVRQCGEPSGACRNHRPEIWEQTGGKVDGFICAWARAARCRAWRWRCSPRASRSVWPIRWGQSSIPGTPKGELESEPGSIAEGIGQVRITPISKVFTPDFACQVTDEEALPIVFDLLEHEGLCMGGLDRRECGGCDAHGARDGAGAHHRHHPVRLRHALSVQVVQS